MLTAISSYPSFHVRNFTTVLKSRRLPELIIVDFASFCYHFDFLPVSLFVCFRQISINIRVHRWLEKWTWRFQVVQFGSTNYIQDQTQPWCLNYFKRVNKVKLTEDQVILCLHRIYIILDNRSNQESNSSLFVKL